MRPKIGHIGPILAEDRPTLTRNRHATATSHNGALAACHMVSANLAERRANAGHSRCAPEANHPVGHPKLQRSQAAEFIWGPMPCTRRPSKNWEHATWRGCARAHPREVLVIEFAPAILMYTGAEHFQAMFFGESRGPRTEVPKGCRANGPTARRVGAQSWHKIGVAHPGIGRTNRDLGLLVAQRTSAKGAHRPS